jgi:hypothetical protein
LKAKDTLPKGADVVLSAAGPERAALLIVGRSLGFAI